MVRVPGQGWQLEQQYRDGAKLSSRQRLHESCSTAETPWHRFVFDLLPSTPGCRVLEVGCGRGLLWAENGDRIDPSWALSLTDMSSGMVAETRRATASLPCRVVTRAANVLSLPFAAGKFDVVVANHMLYHVDERPLALAEMARVMVPGAILLAATNGERHLSQIRELVRPGDGHGETRAFDLDNGPSQLLPWFSDIRVVRHSNRLLIKDPQLVLDYIDSMPGLDLSADYLDEIRSEISRAIEQKGYWEVSPDSGVVTATRRPDLGSRHRGRQSWGKTRLT